MISRGCCSSSGIFCQRFKSFISSLNAKINRRIRKTIRIIIVLHLERLKYTKTVHVQSEHVNNLTVVSFYVCIFRETLGKIEKHTK